MLCACTAGYRFEDTECYVPLYVVGFILILFFYFWKVMKAQMIWCSGLFIIFSSGVEYRILSQIYGRLYLPMFLFSVGCSLLYIYI